MNCKPSNRAPRCNHQEHWAAYFDKHPGRVVGLVDAMKSGKRDLAIAAFGTKYIKFFERYRNGKPTA